MITPSCKYQKMTGCVLVFLIFFANLCFSQDSSALAKQKSDSLRRADSIKNTNKPSTEKKPSATQPPLTNSQITDTAKNAEPEVLKVFCSKTKESAGGIGEIITLEVSHLGTLLYQADSAKQNIALYINGRKIENIKPISGALDKEAGTLQYRLDRNTLNDKTWADILGAPPLFGDNFFDEPVKVSAGLENKYAISTLSNDNNFVLSRIDRGWFWACCVMVIIFLFGFVYMVWKRGLLRDRTINLSAMGISTNSLSNPYSLGRFQMAFWFTLTIISFFFIWLITNAFDIINTTVLALIGISAGTSLSAAVIDNSKSTDLLNQTIELENELGRLNLEIPALKALIASPPPTANIVNLQNDLTTKQARILEIPVLIAKNKLILTPLTSKGFLNDILTDVNGISFHRLQMFAWTFVLGLVFLYEVWKNLSMPVFGATLLALQGLTATTYLGFKFPEKQV